jgi:hypothetical protein
VDETIELIIDKYVSAQQLGFTHKTESAELANRIVALLKKYLVLSPAEFDVLALWVLHTHVLDANDYTPYISVSSAVKRCGKSRVADVLEGLVPRPWKTARCSAAALVRKVDKSCPTLFLDEVDAALKGPEEYSEALRGILNAGFHRGGVISKWLNFGRPARCERHDEILCQVCEEGWAGGVQ